MPGPNQGNSPERTQVNTYIMYIEYADWKPTMTSRSVEELSLFLVRSRSVEELSLFLVRKIER